MPVQRKTTVKKATAKPSVKKATVKKPAAKKKVIAVKKPAAKAANKTATAVKTKKVAAVKKPIAKKTVTKKVTPKKVATTKAAPKKVTAKKVVPKKAVAKTVASKKTVVKKVTPKKVATKKVAVSKSIAAKKATSVKKTTITKTSNTTKSTVKKAAKSVVAKVKPKASAPSSEKITKGSAPKAAEKKAVVKTAPTRKVKMEIEEAVETRVRSPKVKGTKSVSSTTIKPRKASTSAAAGPLGFNHYHEKDGELYMNEVQRNHFINILQDWKRALMEEVDRTMHHLKDEAGNFPDPNDRATQEEEFSLELRTRDRERKLIKKIDEALERLDQDDYGFCEACGIEIGVQRLEARPTATLCIDCKTLEEIREKQMAG